MKVVILAGGLGTRLAEETEIKPKPMVEIGGRPILWHILKSYAACGFKEFYIALGYKGELIKRFFLDYANLNGSLTLQIANGQLQKHASPCDDWTVHLMDTGAETQTGGRLKRLESHLRQGPFMLTYGDGVADVDIAALVEFHRASERAVTLTAVQPLGRFGALQLAEPDAVDSFREKPIGDGDWINGGFCVMGPEIFERIDGDETILERAPLESLAGEGQLGAYKHRGFWQPMDTLRDKRHLGVHTEMFSDGVVDLVEMGVVTNERKTVHRGKMIVGFILGSQRLYNFVHDNAMVEFHPQDYVNDPFVIAQNDKMVAINSAIAVDITGQVCSDSMGRSIYSGFGGQVDFIRGARRSRGGKPIIALPSTAKDGKISRIVDALAEGSGVVTSRADVQYVVTEYGVANLFGKSLRERALALVECAHPDFREELRQAARARKLL